MCVCVVFAPARPVPGLNYKKHGGGEVCGKESEVAGKRGTLGDHRSGVIILILSRGCQSQKMGLFPFSPSLGVTLMMVT